MLMLKTGRAMLRLGRDQGAEIAEAALVLPLVMMLLLGIVWFGRAFNIYSTITQAAQQGAITAARPVCASCGAPVSGWNSFPGDTAVESSVFAVMRASEIDPSQTIAPVATSQVPCPLPPPANAGACVTTGNNVRICRDVQLNVFAGLPQPVQCGAIVTFQYPFNFYLPFTSLNLQTVTMTATAQSRMEN